jgi:hypothetical protein
VTSAGVSISFASDSVEGAPEWLSVGTTSFPRGLPTFLGSHRGPRPAAANGSRATSHVSSDSQVPEITTTDDLPDQDADGALLQPFGNPVAPLQLCLSSARVGWGAMCPPFEMVTQRIAFALESGVV